MTEEVSWHVELSVRTGRLNDFRELTGDMVEATRQEHGVLSYQRYVIANGTLVHLYERYENSAAALAHLRNFAARFGSRFSTMVERRRFIVFGRPSDELRRRLDEYGPTYCVPFGDFSYWG